MATASSNIDDILASIRRLPRDDRLRLLERAAHDVEEDTPNPPDPLDVGARLDELRLLRDGWLEGHGRALDASGLNWFERTFEANFPGDLPLPHVYPTEEGRLRLEWQRQSLDLSLEVDLSARKGSLHSLDLTTDEEESLDVLLTEPAGWEAVAQHVAKLGGADGA